MNVEKGTLHRGFVNIFRGSITDDAYGQHFIVGNFVSIQKFVQNTNLNKVFLFYFFILPHLVTIWRRFPTLVTSPNTTITSRWLCFEILSLTHMLWLSILGTLRPPKLINLRLTIRNYILC